MIDDEWLQIQNEYETTDIGIAKLAEKFGISINTLKSRKNRNKWKKTGSKQKEKLAGNQNAKGNKGGGAPVGNNNGMKHGLHERYIPAETLELMGVAAGLSPLDMLRNQIAFLYASIVRAQQIMHVTHKLEMIKEQKKIEYELAERSKPNKDGKKYDREVVKEEFEFQWAWDRHATFMNAQSKAMTTLSNLQKKYQEMIRQGDEDEERQLLLKKLKFEVAMLTGEIDSEIPDDGFLDALKESAREVWKIDDPASESEE